MEESYLCLYFCCPKLNFREITSGKNQWPAKMYLRLKLPWLVMIIFSVITLWFSPPLRITLAQILATLLRKWFNKLKIKVIPSLKKDKEVWRHIKKTFDVRYFNFISRHEMGWIISYWYNDFSELKSNTSVFITFYLRKQDTLNTKYLLTFQSSSVYITVRILLFLS